MQGSPAGDTPDVPSAPFVLFAGAGVSAGPPACLPGWHALNDAILLAHTHGALKRRAGVDHLLADPPR